MASHTFTRHVDAIEIVEWAPDGMRIASGSQDKSVKVWNARDGSDVYTYRGHIMDDNSIVFGVAWSPDGTRIASGSNVTTVQVWSAQDLRAG